MGRTGGHWEIGAGSSPGWTTEDVRGDGVGLPEQAQTNKRGSQESNMFGGIKGKLNCGMDEALQQYLYRMSGSGWSSGVLRGATQVQTCLQQHQGSNYKQKITVCEMEIEIFHQQKQLIFSNIQTCVIMIGKRNFIIYTEILVYNSMSMPRPRSIEHTRHVQILNKHI